MTTRSESPVDMFIRTGVIIRISVPSNEVWVDERIWYSLNVNRKESFIDIMSKYFNKKRGYERVTVYGGYSGKKLAKTGLMGIKFY